FLESSGDYDGRAHARFNAFANHARYGRRGSDDYGEVDFFREASDGLVAVQAKNLVMLGIDGVDPSGEVRLDQIPQKGEGDGTFPSAGANHGNIAGYKHAIESRATGHGSSCPVSGRG